ncbi:MAG TPA: hypothetical protein VH583_25960 [Vicinamibacterales bacterium]
MLRSLTGVAFAGSIVAAGCAPFMSVLKPSPLDDAQRNAAIARAQLWTHTDIPSMDIRTGPRGPGAFAPGATVTCDYVDEKTEGHSPKFDCAIDGHDKVKVKYGRDNGEVYAEVAATRLLWALGFGADREYPVHVVCRGCPEKIRHERAVDADGATLFDVAAIQRKMAGHELVGPEGRGWAWYELDWVDPAEGGAPRAQRDALKLLAVVLQHSDSKREQQRLTCVDDVREGKGDRKHGHAPCSETFMLINDLGATFGHADVFNRNAESSVNLSAWAKTPVWKDSDRCVGNLTESWSGTLNDPPITEEGRRFLAGLLTQLTDRQIHDLFDVSRFPLRTHLLEGRSEAESEQAWVDAFKKKIDQIVHRSCEVVR